MGQNKKAVPSRSAEDPRQLPANWTGREFPPTIRPQLWGNGEICAGTTRGRWTFVLFCLFRKDGNAEFSDFLVFLIFGDLQTGQTIDNIYKGSFPVLGFDVEINVLEDRASPVNSKRPDDVFPWGHGEHSQTSGICTNRITSLNQDYRDIWDPLVLPVYLCYDKGGLGRRSRFISQIGTSGEGKSKEKYGKLTDHGLGNLPLYSVNVQGASDTYWGR